MSPDHDGGGGGGGDGDDNGGDGEDDGDDDNDDMCARKYLAIHKLRMTELSVSEVDIGYVDEG